MSESERSWLVAVTELVVSCAFEIGVLSEAAGRVADPLLEARRVRLAAALEALGPREEVVVGTWSTAAAGGLRRSEEVLPGGLAR